MKRYFYMILAFLAVTTVSCSTDSVDADGVEKALQHFGLI